MTEVYLKDPSAVLDWTFDWNATNPPGPWLASGETITSHTVTVDTGITKDSSTEAAGKVTVWLSGGTANTSYRVACKIETSAGRTDERTIWVQVADR